VARARSRTPISVSGWPLRRETSPRAPGLAFAGFAIREPVVR